MEKNSKVDESDSNSVKEDLNNSGILTVYYDALDGISEALGHIGRTCAEHPFATLSATLLIIILGFGALFGTFQSEHRGDMLWTDQDSVPKQNWRKTQQFFGHKDRVTAILAQPQSGGNILTVQNIRDMFALWNKVKTVTTGSGVTFDDVCQKNPMGHCSVVGVLNFFKYGNPNATLFETTVKNNQTKLTEIFLSSKYPGTNLEVDWTSMSAGAVLSPGVPSIAANAIFTHILLRGQYPGSGDCSNPDCDQKKWESELMDALGGQGASGPYAYRSLRINKFSEGSIDDELARNVAGETHLFVMTFIFMCTFCSAVLGKHMCSEGSVWSCVEQRWLLGGAGCLLVFFSMAVGYGVAMLTGAKFTTLQMILPFVLLGIGVDDMLIITFAFDEVKKENPGMSVPELCSLTMKNVGLTITLTSLTSTAAFACGSTSKLPAIQWFCEYACISIMVDYVLQCTAFVAMLALDEARQRAHRCDCLPCVLSLQDEETDGEAASSNSVETADAWRVGVEKPMEAASSRPTKDTMLQDILRNKLAPLVLYNTWSKVLIVVLCLLGGAVSSYLYITYVGYGFEIMDLMPDESYVRDYFEAVKAASGHSYNRVDAMLVYSYNPFHLNATQQAIAVSNNRVMANPYTVHLKSWLPYFYAHMQQVDPGNMISGVYLPGSAEAFGLAVKLFFNYTCSSSANGCQPGWQPNLAWQNAAAFREGTNELLAIKFIVGHKHLDSSEEQRDCLESVEWTMETTAGLSPRPYMFAEPYLFFDQYRIIVPELYQSLGLAMACVLLVCGLLMGSWKPVSVVVISLVLVDVDLLGALYFWKLNINSISVINLIMSIGLVVDYSLHLTQSVNTQAPTIEMDVRIATALAEIGPAVLLGACTTLIGIVPLTFAASEVFRVFFRMMLGVVVFSGLHGFFFTPALISLLNMLFDTPLGADDKGAAPERESSQGTALAITSQLPSDKAEDRNCCAAERVAPDVTIHPADADL